MHHTPPSPPFLSGCANTTVPLLSVSLSFAARRHPAPCQCECGPLSLVSGLLCGGVVFKKNRSSRQSSRHSRRLLGVTTGIAPAHCGVGVCVRAGGRGGQSPARKQTERGAFSTKCHSPQPETAIFPPAAGNSLHARSARARGTHQTANGDLETLDPCRYTRPKGTESLTLVRGWWVLIRYTAGVGHFLCGDFQ